MSVQLVLLLGLIGSLFSFFLATLCNQHNPRWNGPLFFSFFFFFSLPVFSSFLVSPGQLLKKKGKNRRRKTWKENIFLSLSDWPKEKKNTNWAAVPYSLCLWLMIYLVIHFVFRLWKNKEKKVPKVPKIIATDFPLLILSLLSHFSILSREIFTTIRASLHLSCFSDVGRRDKRGKIFPAHIPK